MEKVKMVLSTKGSTLFLRLALLGIGGLVAFLSTALLWSVYANWNPEFPELLWLRFPVLFGIFISVISFFVASYQAWKLLDYVDLNNPFSDASISALRNIKYSAFVIGGVFTAAMPLIYWIAEKDDAPGLILFGMVFAGIPLTVAVFAGVLQKLIQNALDIKAENDLTV